MRLTEKQIAEAKLTPEAVADVMKVSLPIATLIVPLIYDVQRLPENDRDRDCIPCGKSGKGKAEWIRRWDGTVSLFCSKDECMTKVLSAP